MCPIVTLLELNWIHKFSLHERWWINKGIKTKKHTKYDLHKEDLYRSLYISLLWCKQITYEDKNEVHSTGFNGRFCKHTALWIRMRRILLHCSNDLGTISNWKLYFQSAIRPLKSSSSPHHDTYTFISTTQKYVFIKKRICNVKISCSAYTLHSLRS